MQLHSVLLSFDERGVIVIITLSIDNIAYHLPLHPSVSVTPCILRFSVSYWSSREEIWNAEAKKVNEHHSHVRRKRSMFEGNQSSSHWCIGGHRIALSA